MLDIDIDIPNIDDTESVIKRVESVLSGRGLLMHTRGSLKSYPGCIHWHWKNGNEKGTLEVTFWPARSRLWFKVQSRRRADWIDRVIPKLKSEMESKG